MTTQLEIVNLALQLVGTRSTVADLAEDSPEATNADLLWDTVRDQLLEEANWNHAKKTAVLARLKALPGTPEGMSGTDTSWATSMPPPPWNYEYELPSDYIKARYVVPQSGWQQLYRAQTLGLRPPWEAVAVPYEIVTDLVGDPSPVPERVLVTNAPDALLVYTWQNTTTTTWPSHFVNAMAARLAYRLSMPLSGDKEIAQGNFALSNTYVDQGTKTDGNEGLTVLDIPTDWIEARDSWAGPYAPWPLRVGG